MLIATTLVALVCGVAPGRIAAPPPLHVNVSLAARVSPSLVQKMLEEADAVWRPSGITFVWHGAGGDRPPTALEIVVGDDRGGPSPLPPLGWILFDEHNVPGRMIHVSYSNAVDLLDQSLDVVGNPNGMPIAERETYLGRAMGRALAHELGHYLLASKSHTRTGLMQGTLRAAELFSPMRERFGIPASLCEAMVVRLPVWGAAVSGSVP